MNWLIEADQHLFRVINANAGNPIFDCVMPLLRNKYFWAPLYLFLIVFLIRQYSRPGLYIIAGLLFTFGITDFVASSIIKPMVQRPRPCNTPLLDVISRVHCGSGYSFPSSHAANHFAIAVFLLALFGTKHPLLPWLFISWAALISLAQVYVGVHFPVDVFCGALLGVITGRLGASVLCTIQPFYQLWKSGNS